MHIILYESSSRGGCYKYAIELFKAYKAPKEVEDITLLLPQNAEFKGDNVHKFLVRDDKTGNKLHFLYRHFINPFRLYNFLRKQKSDKPTFVLFNDFEQMSAPIWAPIFRKVFKNHIFGVFLHDADRDAYPPSSAVSAWCMKTMMKTMDLALYHGQLPERSYYHKNPNTTYLRVQHGIYPASSPDTMLMNKLKAWRKNFAKVFVIPGHIRPEKNYNKAINALAGTDDTALIIAGSPANSKVTTRSLHELAQMMGVSHRIFWIEQFLSEEEMTASILAADAVLLYYSATFHAQSGILNQVAPLKKPVITGDLPNALTETVRKYQLGPVIEPDKTEALKKAMTGFNANRLTPQWDAFFEAASWEKQAGLVVSEVLKKYLTHDQ